MAYFNDAGRNVFQPTVHSSACTGCGKCEEACITAEASIKVLPAALVQRDIGTDIHGHS